MLYVKCSTRKSCIFPKFTSFKIGTLGTKPTQTNIQTNMYFGKSRYLLYFSVLG